MSWPPTDSADVAELRDREPEPTHDERCRRGWLGEDDEGRPIPCLTCRPHLLPKEPDPWD